MIDTIGYICRLVARYWAIPTLVLVLIALLALWLTQARWTGRLSPIVPLAAAIACLLAVAIPTARAIGHFSAAFQGAPARPALTGPHAVASYDVNLAASAEQPALTIRLWRPAASAASLSPGACDAVFALPPPDSLTSVPLILYAPGWGGDRGENARTASVLASAGYLVAALDDSAPQINVDFSTEAATAETSRAAASRLDLALRDAFFALDQIQACVAAEPVWRDKINFNRVGFLGFSFGGAIAAEASLRDPRVGAVANLDGALFGQAAEQGARRPYLSLSSDFDPPSARRLSSSRRHEWRLLYDGALNEAAHARRLGGDIFLLRGAPHHAFLDAYGQGGANKYWLLLPAARAEEIKHRYVLQFFDAALRDRPSDLLIGQPPYEEVMTFSEILPLFERIADAP